MLRSVVRPLRTSPISGSRSSGMLRPSTFLLQRNLLCNKQDSQRTPILDRSISSLFTTGSCGHVASRSLFVRSPARLARGRGGTPPSSSDNQAPNPFGSSGPMGSLNATAGECLTPDVMKHVRSVYAMLASGIGLSFVTAVAAIGLGMPMGVCAVGGLLALGPILYLGFKPDAPQSTRKAMFYGATGLVGLGSAPLIAMGAASGVMLPAFLVASGVFGGFTIAALLARNGSMLRLGGPLMGALLVLLIVQLLGAFGVVTVPMNFMLWAMLAIFSLFVSFDTQAMIVRAQCGETDPTQDAIGLFISFMNIFKTVMMLMMPRD
eukprot:TRINITY_DN3499_c0_g2_i1.p1 TRINITY_DN3499_c0_g2~~TRINITY_DN3499_c0_g2_i1.p1  ORF type:complete len:321 (+),score=46.11 TRINITY_DN3499_c0_g2_i1:115-1077(+)